MSKRLVLSFARLALVFAAGGLAGCGGGSDPAAATDAGYKALGAQDFAAAQAEFEAALTAIGDDTSHPSYVKAKLGAIQTACRTDAEHAQSELMALAEAKPDQVTERTYADIAGRLGDAKNFTEAIAVLAAGKGRFPESTVLDGIGKKLAKQAEQADDPAAQSALAGLGYVGD